MQLKKNCMCIHIIFRKAILIVDFTDFPCNKRYPFSKKSKHHLYKMNKHAIKVQMIITHDCIFRWVGGLFFLKDYNGDCLIKSKRQI